jgi:chemotaxis protein histidine kinase CheA
MSRKVDPVALVGVPTAHTPRPAELRAVFVQEAEDLLRTMAMHLPLLGQVPCPRDTLQEVYRAVHTLKGASATVGLAALTRLAHRMEDILDGVWKRRQGVTPLVLQILATLTEAMAEMVRGSEEREALPRDRPGRAPFATLAPWLYATASAVAAECGKSITLVLEGERTKLERTILDALTAPLLHLVRNAVAHGIERPDARRLCGKPAHGAVLVRALHEANEVVIEVSDDGAGIDVQALRAAAVERGLLSRAAAAGMLDEEVRELIFVPGLSTAGTVSATSGRGVGLDAVRAQVHRLGGTLSVASTPGAGTTLTIRVPRRPGN